LAYGYSAGTPTMLTSVTYSTTPATSQTYLYENAALPSALTGIIDENGNRFVTWTYDAQGRGLSSQHAGGADLTTLAYNADGSTTVTNALGVADTYKFTTLQGVPKVTQISRAATSTTAAATRTFSYDANGYVVSQTDWNGNLTTYVNDVHGQPLTIVEASGTPQARRTTITYLANYHLPDSIITPDLTSNFTYDGRGNVLTKTLIDTTPRSARPAPSVDAVPRPVIPPNRGENIENVDIRLGEFPARFRHRSTNRCRASHQLRL
jgi:YD repeat-containing protein